MKTLVIYAHPLEGSFVSACRDRALEALRRNGHEVRLTDLYADDFASALPLDEWQQHLGNPDDIVAMASYIADLRWAESLVLIYPTWWGGQPAIMKGWIDRVWIHGVAWELKPGSDRITPLLTNIRRITAITTHGSSKTVNMVQGEPGKRIMMRSIGFACRVLTRKTWCSFYGMDRATDADRQAFLHRVDRVVSKL